MDKEFLTLLKVVAESAASSTETVIEQTEKEGKEVSAEMRAMLETFNTIRDKIHSALIADAIPMLLPRDYTHLTIAANLCKNMLLAQIANLEKVVSSYDSDLIPRLTKLASEKH